MLIYLIVFFLSWLSLRESRKAKYRFEKKIFVFLGILIPSILAGLRDYSIGTDINVYGNAWFKNAVQSSDMLEYIKWGVSSSMGVVYPALNFVISRFTDDAHWMYFFLNLTTNFLIYKALKDNEDLVDLPMGMLCYYLIFYNQSLNLLRQSLALAFVACTYIYIRKNQWIECTLYFILAVMTHSSAIVVLLVVVIYKAMETSIKSVYKLLIVMATVLGTVFFSQIVNGLIRIGILSERYEIYINTYLRGGGIVRLVLFCLPYLILFWVLLNDDVMNESELPIIYTFRYLTFISAFGTVLAFRMTYITRILYYFDIFLIMSIPYMSNHLKIKVIIKNKDYTKNVILIIPLIYWIFVYGVRNSGETIPYVFMGV